MTQLTEKQKREIITKYEAHIPVRKIAESLSVSKSTVIFWCKRYDNTKTINKKNGLAMKGKKSTISNDITLNKIAQAPPLKPIV